MSDNKYGQFVLISEQTEFTEDHWAKEHTCEPYLCTKGEDCSYFDEGEHYHQDLCMHKDCAKPAFDKLAKLFKETEDEIYEKMLNNKKTEKEDQ